MNKINAEHFKQTYHQSPRQQKRPPKARGELSEARVKWIIDQTSNPKVGVVKGIFKPKQVLCQDERPLDYNPELVNNNIANINPGGVYNNPNYMSRSQRLVGSPNKKTLQAPVIAPKSLDLDYWRSNNTVHHSSINVESQIDDYQSGYRIMSCCPEETECLDPFVENFGVSSLYINPDNLDDEMMVKSPTKNVVAHVINKSCVNQMYEGFENTMPYLKTEGDVLILANEPGWVNTACGYNPEQLFEAGLPTNLAAGNCTKDSVMKKYNENLFQQTVTPGVYSTSQINEPINSNMGISFTQQFPVLTHRTNPETGELNYTERDPRIVEPNTEDQPIIGGIMATQANVNDPRFTGYGTSYRSYTDDNTGQTRFYYDDVDAIRMPNYITRSNIDNQPFADTYGPIKSGEENGNKFNSDIRSLANQAFLDNALTFRTELQERLMRKANANAWQKRSAPIRTGGQRMLGGMGRIF